MRINKYLASKKYCTRTDADELIKDGRVTINGRVAVLGDKVVPNDTIEVRAHSKQYRYVAYHKPRGILTHSARGKENDIAHLVPLAQVFPVGRLDKESCGLIILTDDGRITDPLLNPNRVHEKEYEVETLHALPKQFKAHMEKGVDIGGYRTKPCTVRILGKTHFSITLTEGKKHQIRRMCGVFGASVVSLKRVRIMNISLGSLREGAYRTITGKERSAFLKALGVI